MFLWCRSPPRTPSHETLSHRHLRSRGLRCGLSRGCRGLGARHPGDRRSLAIFCLGHARLSYARASTCRFAVAFASCRPLVHRPRPVVLSPHRIVLRYAHGGPASPCRYSDSLFGLASLPHSGRLAWLRMVCNELWILRGSLRHPSAPHFQWKTLLVSRDAFWRHSLRSLRES